MKLTNLDPRFLKFELMDATITKVKPDGSEEQVTEPRQSARLVDTLAEADGIMFLCPVCFITNKGPVGTHSVVCWFEGKVPDTAEPKPGRWLPTGSSIEDLSFVPHKKSNSVLLLGGCNAHFFITLGEIK